MPSPVRAETTSVCRSRIDPQRMGEADADVEIEMRQQVGLVEQHEIGGDEHVGIFERLVLAFGHRQHHHLVRLAEVESRRADQIADILDEQQRAWHELQRLEGVADHMGVEVAALAGIDLDGGAPVARMRSASFEVCWSPSITAIAAWP